MHRSLTRPTQPAQIDRQISPAQQGQGKGGEEGGEERRKGREGQDGWKGKGKEGKERRELHYFRKKKRKINPNPILLEIRVLFVVFRKTKLILAMRQHEAI